MSINKLAIIGLDGATWDLLGPWMDAGYLPNLADLRERGVWGRLSSTIQPITAPAWTSFMTGMNSGRHGVFDFVRRQRDKYAIEITNASMISVPAIFDYLGAGGFRVASVNVPFTFPPRPIENGVMVSGLFATTTGPAITYPPSLWERVARVAPDYQVNPDYDPKAAEPLEAYLRAQSDAVENRVRVAEMLLAENWDVFMLVFTATDQLQHAFWHCLPGANVPPIFQDHPQRFGNPILKVYQQVDQNLPRLLKHLGPAGQVWVLSDHGAGPLHSWVQLNRWLEQAGFLSFRQRARQAGLLGRAIRAYKRYVPDTWRRKVRFRLGSRFDAFKGGVETAMLTGAIDWRSTQAYSLGACGNIFVNLRGREPMGIVEPGAMYETLRQKLIKQLLDLRDPQTDQSLVDKVLLREEVYQGPYLNQAPDLLIIWRDYRYWGRGRYDVTGKEIFEKRYNWDFSELPLTGTHRPEGVLLAAGAGLHKGIEIKDARLVDLVPSFLASLGMPIPADLDGKVLLDAFETHPQIIPGPPADRYASTAFAYSDDDAALIQQRLEELGYL